MEQKNYSAIEKEAAKWLKGTDTMQFSQMELLTMFAAHWEVKNAVDLADVIPSKDELCKMMGWSDYEQMLLNTDEIEETGRNAINLLFESKGYEMPFY